MNNLLLGLHKCAGQQDENFTTEAFVHLLRHLQIVAPDTAGSLINFLTGSRVVPTIGDCSNLKVTTQKTFMEGRPDILISGPNHFVIIEVKDGAMECLVESRRPAAPHYFWAIFTASSTTQGLPSASVAFFPASGSS
jgi:hypothetical protein